MIITVRYEDLPPEIREDWETQIYLECCLKSKSLGLWDQIRLRWYLWKLKRKYA